MITAPTAIGLAAIASLASTALAGPLNPPAGPITDSKTALNYKTLAEIEARTPISPANTPGDGNSIFRITQPGSYYLTGNVAGQSGRANIEIASSNVTVDLNGFALTGVEGSIAAVINDGLRSGIAITNGSISAFPDRGVWLTYGNTAATSTRLTHLRVVGCAVTGIDAGPSTQVDSCVISECDHGVTTRDNSIVSNCTVTFNSGYASQGIGVGTGSIVERCALRWMSTGISAIGSRCTIRSCVIDNSLNGISGGVEAVVDANQVTGASNVGIAADEGSRIANNAVQSSQSTGIWARGSQMLVTDNVVKAVRNAQSQGDGIFVNVTESRVSIRNNTVIDCDRGIRVTGSANAVFGNQLTSNTTQFQISANNRVGQIVAGPLSAAVNGSTGGGGMGSTDPYANLLY